MAQKDKSERDSSLENWRPGSEPERAKEVGSGRDFGESAGQDRSADRDYVSENTKRSDRGKTQPAAWEEDGVRDHGAGGRAGGPGSASGGDLDMDIIGVGTGGSGVSQSGPGRRPGPDDSDGSSNEFASPVPKGRKGEVTVEAGQGREPSKPAEGTFVQGRDGSTGKDAQGADAATNPAARDDDSFAGELSGGEARGQDNPMSPSSDDGG